jgi:glycogen phosphorylase
MSCPNLPEPIQRLGELASNLWWSWHPQAEALFQALDPVLWERIGHNPVKLLWALAPEQLERVAADPVFLGRYHAVLNAFDAEMNAAEGWFTRQYPQLTGNLLAYFSAEFGLHNSLPVYAGGLGILAGDHVKEASDLGLPLVGVGFMYPEGYVRQRLRADGHQEEVYERLNWAETPLEPACMQAGMHCVIPLQLPDRPLHVAVWRLAAGRVPLYLMDTNLEVNAPWDRELSARLYGGDQEMRLRQEIALGIGGMRLLREFKIAPTIWHANEGHTAFMMVERVREQVEAGLSFEQAVAAVRATTIFTTHTPVPAGHDVFPFGLIDKYLGVYWPGLGLNRDRFLALGAHQEPWGAAFNMTALALRLAGHCNGVSRRHGQVARRMWRSLWPNVPAEEVPIESITNGVHVPTWVAAEVDDLYRAYVDSEWITHHDDPELWKRVDQIPNAALWETHLMLKRQLLCFLRNRVRHRWTEDRVAPVQVVAAGALLEVEPLTLGFARRFATYKRATLLLRDRTRLKAILTATGKPVQLIFAGKAHPADEPGKQLLQTVYQTATDPEFAGHIAVVEDYDMHVARHLVQGVDVWLNTPQPPLEASGTSGQKAALNGVPNLSVLDGWWAEGYVGTNGWAIGSPEEGPADPEARDAADTESLYRLLEDEVVPLYYARGPDGLPHGWLQVMKRAIQTGVLPFSARRMVKEYTERLYVPAARVGREKRA